jgi:DNA-directed RNA polymerase specialized sigma24 family protein
MIAASQSHPGDDWHAGFLALLPRIEMHARFAFHRLSAEAQEDAVQEVIANALVAYVRLAELRQDEWAFATVLARYGVAQTREGRRVGSHLNSRDVLSRYAQKKRGFKVKSLDRPDRETAEWAETFGEGPGPAIPDQAGFHVDFLDWLATQPERKRQIVKALVIGDTTAEIAQRFGLSPGRISQIKRELRESWREFQGR